MGKVSYFMHTFHVCSARDVHPSGPIHASHLLYTPRRIIVQVWFHRPESASSLAETCSRFAFSCGWDCLGRDKEYTNCTTRCEKKGKGHPNKTSLSLAIGHDLFLHPIGLLHILHILRFFFSALWFSHHSNQLKIQSPSTIIISILPVPSFFSGDLICSRNKTTSKSYFYDRIRFRFYSIFKFDLECQTVKRRGGCYCLILKFRLWRALRIEGEKKRKERER